MRINLDGAPYYVRVPAKLLGHCDVTDVFILHGISMDDATAASHINAKKCKLVSSALFSTDLVYNSIRSFLRGPTPGIMSNIGLVGCECSTNHDTIAGPRAAPEERV